MEKSEKRQVTKNVGLVGGLTFLSRIFGFIRDAAMAWFFGAGLISDAFFVAFRIPNLLKRIFSEGILSLAFIPVFMEHISAGKKEDAFHLARSAFMALFLILSAATVAGFFFAPVLVTAFAPGFVLFPEKFALTVSLTRMMFPFIILIGLSAISMAVLNTFGHFAAPTLSPLVINLSMIGAIFFISPQLTEPVKGLAIGVIIGGILQLALQAPFLLETGVFFRKTTDLFHKGLKKIGALTLPAALGASVFQVNMLLDTLIASFLSEGSISHLYYADRIVQFPLGIFGIAAAMVLFPSLSKEASLKNYDALAETICFSLKMVLFVTVPAMAGLVILREPIVSLLFERGAFDAQSVQLTAGALLYYSLGLWAFTSARIVVSTFYALQDAGTPVRIALFCILLKLIMAVVFMRFIDYKGLALSTSLASVLNLVFILRALQIKLGHISWRNMTFSLINNLPATVLMSFGVVIASRFIPADVTASLIIRLSTLFGCIFFGIISYMIFSILFKSHEIQILSEMIKQIRGEQK
jgi:putative peptidoglycan lipid II flippase